MTMRYLGLGIGHMNPAAFPSEADAISAVPEPRYVPAQTKNSNESASTASSNPTPMVLYHSDQVFSHASRPKKRPLLKFAYLFSYLTSVPHLMCVNDGFASSDISGTRGNTWARNLQRDPT